MQQAWWRVEPTFWPSRKVPGVPYAAYGTNYKWPGGTAPTLSTAAAAVDVLTFYSPTAR